MTDILILVLILISSTLVTVDSHLSTSNNPPLSYTTYPQGDRGRVVSSYSNSSSNSSPKSSPPSPGPKIPPDKDSSAPLTPIDMPVHINFINPLLDIKMKHSEIHIQDERERT